MGLMDSLFGGSSSQETQRTYISPEQMPFLKQLWQGGQQLYRDAQQPDYMNQAISGGVNFLNQRQPYNQANQALNQTLNPGADPYQQYSSQMMGPTMNAWQNMMGITGGGDTPGPDAYLNEAMKGQVNLDPYNQAFDAASNKYIDSATRAYQDAVPLERLQSYFTTGAPSTRTGLKLLQGARGFGQDLTNNLSNLASSMYLPAYQQAQNLAGQASQTASQLGQARGQIGEQARQFNYGQNAEAARMGLNQLSGAYQTGLQGQLGGLQTAPSIWNMGYSPYQEQLNLGQQQMNLPWLPLMNYANIIGNPAMESYGQSSTSQTGGIIPGLGSLFKGVGALAPDRR